MSEEQYKAIPLHGLHPGASFCRPWQEFPDRVTLDSPAIDAMTDLRKMSAQTIPPNAPIDRALDKMIQTGVRLLLVVSDDRGVLGVITARDIQGEKPMKVQQDMGVARSEILVRDVMTPQGKVAVLRMEEVREATIGDVVMTLKKDCRQHALVIDEHKDTGVETIRGIYSATQISRLLGIQVRFDDISKTFEALKELLG
ncbi:CBS domain-containing protein [Endothiovibrio diazotrophicus]